MCWLLVAVLVIAAAGCGGDDNAGDETVRAEMAKVETTCAEGVNCGHDRASRFRKCTHPSRGFRRRLLASASSLFGKGGAP
jgi:hypothetical protein